MGHAHHHHGAVELDVPRPVRRALLVAVIPLVVLTAIGVLVLRPSGAGPDLGGVFDQSAELERGKVVGSSLERCLGNPVDAPERCQTITVRIESGDDAGDEVQLEMGGTAGAPTVDVGDEIRLGVDQVEGGAPAYYFADFDRDRPVLVLAVLFVLAAVVFGRWSGVRALLALVASLLVIVWFVIPAVLDGRSPVAVAIVGSAVIMLAVLYVTGGFTAQTTVTVLGTMVSLALIAALAAVFVAASELTGLADENAVFLSAASGSVNVQGLLLGGIVIGSLGVLDDMTVTQVSTVWELRRANPRYDLAALYRSAERVGRDHIASTINTLVLAYAGASLPLLIFFTQSNLELGQILTSEVIAVEIVRTLVGSIGLIASVPITTALAAFVVTRVPVPDETVETDEAADA